MIAAKGALLAVALVGCIAGPAAAAAQGKSDIEIKNRAAEITVNIAKELKSYPHLVADLLAEGRRFAAQAGAEAEAEYKTDSEWFKQEGGRRWTYERIYSLRSLIAGRYVGVIRHDGTYTGGAHPNSQTDTILWDRKAARRVGVRPFFKETADGGPTLTTLTKLVRLAVAKEKLERWKEAAPDDERSKQPQSAAKLAETDSDILRGVQPKLLKIGPISFAPSTVAGKSSGLTFHFSPYDVDAYAAGPYTVFVPWTAFRGFLSAEGAAIFGGERLANDDL